MKRIFVFVMLIFSVGFNTNLFSQDTKRISSNIEFLTLDTNTLLLPCAPGSRTPEPCLSKESTKVSINANLSKKSILTYEYAVTGGKIIGQGEKVVWNLEGARPGTYSITATIKRQNKIIKTASKTITMAECAECLCQLCECPSVSISSTTEYVFEGEEIVLVANISGGSQTSVEYKWQVSSGEIMEGQNSPSIKISTKGLKDKSITATLEILLQTLPSIMCEACEKIFTKTIEIKSK